MLSLSKIQLPHFIWFELETKIAPFSNITQSQLPHLRLAGLSVTLDTAIGHLEARDKPVTQ